MPTANLIRLSSPPLTRADRAATPDLDSVTDVVVDLSTGAPTIVYWGASLGDDGDDTANAHGDDTTASPQSPLLAARAALDRPLVHGAIDTVAPISLVPEHGSGFPGRPGLRGRRADGQAWAPRFQPSRHHLDDAGRLVVTAQDDVAGLRLTTTIALGEVLQISAEIENLGADDYLLDGLTLTLPVPEHAGEILTFAGRWSREFHPQRQLWTAGAIARESRRGRTSHETPPLTFVGQPGFGEWHGEVFGIHLAWSGNHTLVAERLPDGRRYLQTGELLHPGELTLAPGASYRTPTVLGVYSPAGLTAASQRFHRALRSRPSHPKKPRPTLLNTWEAVYFAHNVEMLKALADAAADIGIERFVLDDGWFGSRRSDRQGLGDWWVARDVYPDGLAPLIEHVTGLGMEFGIWVEPEMVNPDSDLYRAHPEWALTTDGYDPVQGRHQLVLDIGHPDAFAYLLEHLDALLRDHDISYVKWDMNRDHIHGSDRHGRAGTHRQTQALYRLLAELRGRHPEVEIESCASGGGRIDHEILRYTDRVWTSDCNDALERQRIQRGASTLIPPELMGAHIGPSTAHTTGRTQTLQFRAATAFFGHLGVEWNIIQLSRAERRALKATIALHKKHRALLHSGDVVRFDTEPAYCAHGVYAADRSSALVSFAALTSAASLTPPPLRLPGLPHARRYRAELLHLPSDKLVIGPGRSQPAWCNHGVTLTGRQLRAHGLQPPAMHPESAILIQLTGL
ncbi:MAG: alpha-galactosidase [Haliangiales bacterium]